MIGMNILLLAISNVAFALSGVILSKFSHDPVFSTH